MKTEYDADAAFFYPYTTGRTGTPLFHGQKPTDYGQSGRNVAFVVCYDCNRNLHTKRNGGFDCGYVENWVEAGRERDEIKRTFG
ncbi:MAG: hypothetical protein HFI32_08020 [Lachnospiraceae bacterium]|jgi:hypothetical protein|nr:hypothetical protein [Lachnospiraceae bacterium]